MSEQQPEDRNGFEIAVIGMAGRFPGAENVDRFWRNLCDGVESVHFFSDQELLAAGVSPQALARSDYVKARAVLAGPEMFDAELFGFTPREAEITDPQHRLFLECAWEALEDAGYDSSRYPGDIGLYAGAGLNTYAFILFSRPEVMQAIGAYQAFLATDKDFLATRTSYKLNLTGPSVSVQTACSTSLVAVHMACQALLAGECQMALAGGVSVSFPQEVGYFYEEGGIHSPDGHCRAFDARAGGTVSGSGLGVVVLKRLEDALAEGDRILAVLKGSAINNDGSHKIGFTAPSVEGQARVIRMAQAIAGVDPGTIGYVEAHGTGTALGDPIEIAALRRAFEGRHAGRCAVGAVKTNIGHLDTAAGISGLIKTILALDNKMLPPTLHFSSPNERIDFAGSPFHVNDRLVPWETAGTPRRAGVSSFGMGGTNAHVIAEEAPAREPSGPSRPWQLLVLSARSKTALDQATVRLREHLRAHPRLALPDVAFTLQTGRRSFAWRRALVCRDLDGAVELLSSPDAEGVLTRFQEPCDRPVAFLFPGQGSQHVSMGRELYQEEDTFREQMDLCCDLLRPHLGLDLREVLYPRPGEEEAAARELERTALAQPALFAVEYALARLWMEWGAHPGVMIGHSLGEYVAACLAGVLSLSEALSLVALRGRLMQALPGGAMLAVPLPEAAVLPLLGGALSLAAINGPDLCVVSGLPEAVGDLELELASRGCQAQRLHTGHAFHSAMMDPILEAFGAEVRKLRLQSPSIPYFSNLTGRLVRPEEATDPSYWVRHLRETVRFGDSLSEVLQEPNQVLLEVGPGRTLGSLARRNPGCPPQAVVVSSLPHREERQPASAYVLSALSRLWLAGIEVDWSAFYAREHRRRVALPTYPFERKAYWIVPRALKPEGTGLPESGALSPEATPEVAGDTVAGPAVPQPAVHEAGSRPNLDTPYAEPRDGDERRIAAILETLLGIRPVGRHDNFFELGGHSLAATRLAVLLRAEMRLDLPLRDLLEQPTVAAMAAVAARRREGGSVDVSAPDLPALVPDPLRRHEPFRLTDVQQAYWLGRGDAFELGNVATHNYWEIEIAGLDLDRFAQALRRMIERHDMLRAVVLADGRQQVLPDVPAYEIETFDLTDLEPDAAARELETLRRQMSHQVLPSSRWPLFEVRAARLPGGLVRLHVSFDFLIGDAWSWQLLLAELAQHYADPARQLLSPEISFRDYVLFEEAIVRSALYERSGQYWRERLGSLPQGPELPLARDIRSLAQPAFVRRVSRLQPEAWAQLKARAARAGLTPSGLVAAVFAEVLTVWSKTLHFTLNLTLFNRLPVHPDVNRVIGDFTSLTLLEVDNRGSEAFRARAQRLQARLWEDLDHRYFSGVRVLRELGRSRGTTGRVAMPVVFTSTLTMAETDPAAPESLPAARIVYSISQTPQVWLDHQAAERKGALLFNWDAVEELFPAGLLDDMFQAYQLLLGRLAEDDAAWEAVTLAEDLLPAWQREQRQEVNATRTALPETTLHELFRSQALRRPDQVAVIAADRRLTYGELDQLSLGLARRLRALGAAPNRLVAIVMEKGWEQVVAALAVVRAGAAYLPIDPGLPPARIQHLLEQGEARLALTQPWLEGRIAWSSGIARICVPLADPEPAAEEPWVPEVGPRDLAYVIFTSGSTGLPKGVMIDHRGAVNTILDINRRFGVEAGDRVLAISSLSFDLSVYDIFGLLAAGGAMVLPSPRAMADPAHWTELMEREGITVWNSVPALFEMLVEHAGSQARSFPHALRLVLLSGDWIPVGLPDRLRSLRDGVTLIGMGGATEASIWSIFYPIGEVDPAWASIPYGRPLANQTFHVLDDHLAPRPAWVPGELYIGGIGVALGYWRDAEKTALRFVESPRTGERLYRTGDLGRYLADGNIEFLGREDLQVKINGYRIELGEIEATLARYPGLQAAVVAAVGEGRSGSRLVAYVVPASRELSSPELEGYLRERLPAYMVPTSFVKLDALPLTGNGKVDRRALPAPDADRRPAEEGAVATATPVQEILCDIWSGLLGVRGFGLQESFFELGGDSLQAVRTISRIREVFGMELPLRHFFELPTVADVALEIERMLSADAKLVAPPIRPLPRGSHSPLSFAQQRLWFLDRLQPRDPAYNIPAAFRLSGEISVPVLDRCLGEIVRRHESLRTTFQEIAGEPRQRVHPPSRFRVPVVALDALPEECREAEARRLQREEARRPFDLVDGPLLRIQLLRLAPGEHVALATFHHVVSDAWSLGVLMNELAALYGAFSAGLPSPLPELPVQYADYAEWQRSWLVGESLETLLAYWRERFSAPPPALSLPTDRPRRPAGSSRAGYRRFRLDRSLVEEMRGLSRSHGATLFMALLAGFFGFLHRYTYQDDLVVGFPVANRGRREIEGLIGCFINMLALRADLSGSPAFRDLLARVRETTLGAIAHQDLPFDRLVEELQPRRDLTRSPLFQAMLVLQNAPSGDAELPGLRLAPVHAETVATQYDLTLTMVETAGELRASFEYAADLFDPATVDQMAAHLEALFRAAVLQPGDRIAELPILSDEERRQLVSGWGAGRGETQDAGCVHELFERQARRDPDVVAVLCEGRRLTYRELSQEANSLAQRLRALGVRPGSRVGVSLQRSERTIVALLGILKTGAAYVPLDPELPAARLRWMLDDAGVEALVTEAATAELFGPEVARLDLDRDALAGASAEEPTDLTPSELAAYVIYTSGSTGRPKGVEVSHRALTNYVQAAVDLYSLAPADRVLQFASLSFDTSAEEIYPCLACGATLVMRSSGMLGSDAHFLEACDAWGITVLDLPTAYWHQLVRALEGGLKLPPFLRLVILGGEAAQAGALAAWRKHAPPAVRLVNTYGPTEATIVSTVWEADEGAGEAPLRVPIGRPVAGSRAYVVGPRWEILPEGLPGELWIGGHNLAQGYLRAPDITAARFVPDPFQDHPGARAYRTGDLVRWLPEGDLEFLGRLDHQVKVRGFRIEPGEIEAKLAQHSTVSQAVVDASEVAPGDRRLIGYVVPRPGQTPDAAELRAFLLSSLPSYMVPASFVVLESLPLTPSRKIDRAALPGPEAARPQAAAPSLGPIEEIVAAIWSDLLGRSETGLDQDFFALGGHSLLATQVLSRIRTAFGVEVPLRTLFDRPTVAGLAQAIGELRTAPASDGEPPLVPVSRAEALPASFAQTRLWFLDQLAPGSSAYNISVAVLLDGRLDVAALARALTEVTRRHESLRTRFESHGGVPYQVIDPPTPRVLPVADLTGLDAGRGRDEALARAYEEAQRPFDLAAGPLWRILLMRLGEESCIAVLTIHHIVSDAWSLNVLMREIGILHETFVAGLPSPLPEPELQYADFAHWQRKFLQGEVLDRQLRFWKCHLEDAPRSLPLPFDYPPPPFPSLRGASEPLRLTAELSSQIRALGRREEATLFMTLFAAFVTLLFRYSGQTDIVVSTGVANRHRREVEGLVGFFVNTLPLRADFSGEPTFRQLVRQIRESVLEGHAHQDLPFERLVEELQPERRDSHAPLSEVVFDLDNLPPLGLPQGGLSMTPIRLERGTAKLALVFMLRDRVERITGELEYSTDRFRRSTIQRMLEHYVHLLAAVVAEPDRCLLDIPLDPEAEPASRFVSAAWEDESFSFEPG